MPIVSYDDWRLFTGQNLTSPQQGSVSAICAAVSEAIKRETGRVLERGSFSIVLDAPVSSQIRLLRWAPLVIEDMEVYLNYYANGDPDAFTSSSLLTAYTDYTFRPGDDGLTIPSGVITRIGYGGQEIPWGGGSYSPPYSLTPQRRPQRGSIKVVFTGGFYPVPMDIKQAAVQAVTKIWRAQPFGGQIGSESWNGYSMSLPSAALAALADPAITMTLDRYKNYGAMVAGSGG